jgi:hypothetical protein
MSANPVASCSRSAIESVVDARHLRATGTLRRKKMASLRARRQGATRRTKTSGSQSGNAC